MPLPHMRGNELGVLFLTALLVLGFAAASLAQSQAGAGQIVGTVLDASGAAIPGAKVSVTNKDTGLTREVEANDQGQYRVGPLPPGPYSVTVKHPGFKISKTDVEVTVGSTLTIDPRLDVGMATETIEVTASVVVETTAPQNDALINLRSIANLPINGRRFHDFVQLTPTVQIEPQRNGISFAGQRGINANVTVDGADYNEPFFGGIRGGERGNNAFSVPQEAIKEFQVVPYGYSAEFGRSTGGIVNAVTKSGTNEWHGSAFYFLRHKELAKKDAFNRLALDEQHQFGGSVGGPIRRDHSFLFFSIEDQQVNNPRQVIFRNLLTPLRTTFNAEAFDFYRSEEGPFNQTNDAITLLGRFDEDINTNNRVSVRYHYSKNTALNAVATGDQIFPETNRTLTSNGTEGDRTHNITGTWTSFFTPRMVNELRAQWSREDRPRTANAQQAAISNTIGDTGTRSFLPTTLFDYRVQIVNSLTWNPGQHSVKVGGEWNRLFVDQFFKFNQFGFFSMSAPSGCATTPGFVAWHLNTLSVGSDPALTGTCADPANRFDHTGVTYRVNIGNGQLKADMQELAFFIQDAWRWHPRFTLTAGFRWEGYFNPSPDTSNTSLTSLVQNFAFNLGRVNPGFIPDNFRQYMPRLGMAWDPWGDSKTVIRANAGIYFARTPMLLFAAPLNNFRTPAGDLSASLPLRSATGAAIASCAAIGVTPLVAGDTCNTVYWQMRRIGIDMNTLNFTTLPTLTQTDIGNIATALGLTIDPNRGLAPLTWADNYEAPRSWQWGVGFDREIGRGWSAGADFVYINTVHLQRNRDWNLPAPFLPTADGAQRPCFGLRTGITGICPGAPSPTNARPIATLASMQVRESNSRALYKALTFRSVYRRSQYQFQGYYTLSKTTSDDDNERDAGGQSAVNAYNLRPEFGYSRLDARHLFVFNSIADLPWGFTVSGLMRLRSARPIEPVTGGDTNGDFITNDRPFRAPGVPFPRNSFRDRAIYNIDLRVAKRFNLPREGMRVDITADFFNIFDFDNVTYGFNSRIFGTGINNAGVAQNPLGTFQQLYSPANCATIPSCYDTRNTPGSPFQMQVGVRFQF